MYYIYVHTSLNFNELFWWFQLLEDFLLPTKVKFEDANAVIRSRQSKEDRQHNGQNKKDKRTSNDLQILHRKLKIEQIKSHQKSGVNIGAPEGSAVRAPYVTPVVLLINDMDIIWCGNRVGRQYA